MRIIRWGICGVTIQDLPVLTKTAVLLRVSIVSLTIRLMDLRRLANLTTDIWLPTAGTFSSRTVGTSSIGGRIKQIQLICLSSSLGNKEHLRRPLSGLRPLRFRYQNGAIWEELRSLRKQTFR